MRETPEDLARLQELLDRSYSGQGEHISSIITDERRLTAKALCEQLPDMVLLALATTTADGRPLVSAVDGFFYRGEFWFGTGVGALKVQHIKARPAVSAVHMRGEELGVTVHGRAVLEGSPVELAGHGFAEVATDFYGEGWAEWGDEAVYGRIEADKMFVFHMEHPPQS